MWTSRVNRFHNERHDSGGRLRDADSAEDRHELVVPDGSLNALGVEVVEKYIVGDDRLRLANLIAYALGHSEFIFITGGLGPTEDDITRDAAAVALGRSQSISPEICETIAARFRRLGRKMWEVSAPGKRDRRR